MNRSHADNKKIFTIFGLMIILLRAYAVNPCYAVDETEASTEIAYSENGIESAYLAVNEAESLGVEISGLVVDLTQAVNYLNQAKTAMKSRDFDNAVLLSRKALQDSDQIIVEASDLMHDAELNSEKSFQNQLILSLLNSIIIVILGFVGWKYFKSYYFRRMLRLKPVATWMNLCHLRAFYVDHALCVFWVWF